MAYSTRSPSIISELLNTAPLRTPQKEPLDVNTGPPLSPFFTMPLEMLTLTKFLTVKSVVLPSSASTSYVTLWYEEETVPYANLDTFPYLMSAVPDAGRVIEVVIS